MTTLYKHRIIIDLDQTMGPIQATLELHTLDSRTVHRITTWTPGPFESAAEILNEMLDRIERTYGVQPDLLTAD